MAASAGGIYVDLGLNSARFQEGMKRAGKELDTFGTRAGKASAVAKAAFAGIGAGLTAGMAGLGAGGAAAGIKAITSSLAQLNAESKRAGVGVEAFQELAYAAAKSRVGVDALTDGLKELQLRTDEFVVTGQGSAAEAFQRLGYSADELKEKLAAPDLLFAEIIDKLAGLDKAAQIRISDELFGGTGGEQFVQMLDRGVGSITRFRKEARDAGVVVSKELIEKAIELDRQFNTIATTVGSTLKQAVVTVATTLSTMLDMLNKISQQSTATVKTRLDLAKSALPRYKNLGYSDSYIATREAEIKELEAELASRPLSITVPAPGGGRGAAPAGKAKKAGGSESAGSSGDSKRTYEDLIGVANERIAQLQIEQQALGLTTAAAETLRFKQDLLNEVTREGIKLSPEQAADLASRAEAYGRLSGEIQRAADANSEMNGMASDSIGGIISDLRNGVDAADAFANALEGVIDNLIQMSLNSLFPTGGGGGGGVFAAFGKALGFADGGYTGDKTQMRPMAILSGGAIVPPVVATQTQIMEKVA